MEGTAEKARYIRSHRFKFTSISEACKMIGISRSSFYAHSEKKALEREEKYTDLLSKIEEIHLEMPFYGIVVFKQNWQEEAKK